MKTTFTSRHFEASNRLHDYSVKTVKKLEKFFDGIIDCDIVLQPNEDHDEPNQAELIVKVPNDLLNVSETGATYEQAILKAVDTMKRQLIRYKEKRFAK
ncbi:MAG: ribosome-associated translation inhibitor RaiA [Balneolaceae bacterium]|nr:MAG: ribosome-associated translation inhibitor RaiA [Balneolaceae bacterium]